MKLIDEIIDVTEEYAITSATTTPDWPLMGTSGINPIVMIELVAQTTGVCNGWKEMKTNDAKLGGRGWIVGIKKADFLLDWIPLNYRLTTRTENMFGFDNYLEIKGIIHNHETPVGNVVLQVFRSEKDNS